MKTINKRTPKCSPLVTTDNRHKDRKQIWIKKEHYDYVHAYAAKYGIRLQYIYDKVFEQAIHHYKVLTGEIQFTLGDRK